MSQECRVLRARSAEVTQDQQADKFKGKRPGGEAAEGIEPDNLIVDERFTRQGCSSKDSEFGLIYLNGDNNLENLKGPDDTWKARLIEKDFCRLMFETEGV